MWPKPRFWCKIPVLVLKFPMFGPGKGKWHPFVSRNTRFCVQKYPVLWSKGRFTGVLARKSPVLAIKPGYLVFSLWFWCTRCPDPVVWVSPIPKSSVGDPCICTNLSSFVNHEQNCAPTLEGVVFSKNGDFDTFAPTGPQTLHEIALFLSPLGQKSQKSKTWILGFPV